MIILFWESIAITLCIITSHDYSESCTTTSNLHMLLRVMVSSRRPVYYSALSARSDTNCAHAWLPLHAPAAPHIRSLIAPARCSPLCTGCWPILTVRRHAVLSGPGRVRARSRSVREPSSHTAVDSAVDDLAAVSANTRCATRKNTNSTANGKRNNNINNRPTW